MAARARLSRPIGAVAIAAAAGGGILLFGPTFSASDRGEVGAHISAIRQRITDPNVVVPSRATQASALIGANSANPLDMLVIGGGATGSGVALDAVTRGLRVGLVEREDFASGTSSRSTKLIHGGVRYLEKAVFNLDYGQLKLVFHALEERKQLIENAPHLCHALPCMTPCFEWFDVVYYWAGLKMYDLVAGRHLLHLSRYYSAQESSELFPTLARKGKDRNLKGTVVYFDGQMNDSRLNVGVACTAAVAGAAVLNHAEVVAFLRDEDGKRIIGARIRDNLSGKEFDTYAKVIVNAAGPFCDSVRKMVRRTDVLSAWSGIRPLATDPSAKNTESISRDHVVCEDYPGLVTITGGKWTTYRSMAEDAVNAAIKSGKLSPTSKCITQYLRIIGGDGWDPSSFTVLAQQYVRMKKNFSGKVVPGVMDTAVAKHLSHAYGTMAERVAAIAQNEHLGKRLAHGYPYLEAEVAYCARHEYCESAVDFIARRSRLAFLDTDAAGRALPRIIEILAAEHNWDKSRKKEELEKGKGFLETFKSSKNAQFHDGIHK
ncbi:glycerol-3-phosphate dehydrogenase sdp6 [Quercus suber]|uniref:Glycerol-3-phosphate dehydrogenase n=1 Tax=Quercus suber TaxID=58331 RepID=A0AAW0KYI1_QUESU